MDTDFQIGSSGITKGCKLKFHDSIIYDSVNWDKSGIIVWNAVKKCFDVLPDEELHMRFGGETEKKESPIAKFGPKKMNLKK